MPDDSATDPGAPSNVRDFMLSPPTVWALGVIFGRAAGLLSNDDWGDLALFAVFGLAIAWMLWKFVRIGEEHL